MTNTEYLRDRILKSRNILTYIGDITKLRKTEWNKEFEYYQRNRLIFGAYRYGLIFNKPNKYNYADDIIKRLKLYKDTGNKELLIDIANLAMLEFGEPSINGTYFSSNDDTIHVKEL